MSRQTVLPMDRASREFPTNTQDDWQNNDTNAKLAVFLSHSAPLAYVIQAHITHAPTKAGQGPMRSNQGSDLVSFRPAEKGQPRCQHVGASLPFRPPGFLELDLPGSGMGRQLAANSVPESRIPKVSLCLQVAAPPAGWVGSTRQVGTWKGVSAGGAWPIAAR